MAGLKLWNNPDAEYRHITGKVQQVITMFLIPTPLLQNLLERKLRKTYLSNLCQSFSEQEAAYKTRVDSERLDTWRKEHKRFIAKEAAALVYLKSNLCKTKKVMLSQGIPEQEIPSQIEAIIKARQRAASGLGTS